MWSKIVSGVIGVFVCAFTVAAIYLVTVEAQKRLRSIANER